MAKNVEHIVHKRSSVIGKTPEAAQLEYGEIAVNYSKDNEKLFIKNSDDEIVDITQPVRKIITEIQTNIANIDTVIENVFESAEYNSTTKKIIFKNKDGEVKSEINATDFIKDGMVENVEVVDNNLVITFNTDAGKEPISIPLTDIFNPNNYYNKNEVYNKTEVDSRLSNKADNSALNAEIAARKAVDGQDGQTYTANTDTTYINEAASLNDADVKLDAALKTLNDNVIDNELVVSSALNDLEARKADKDTVYTKEAVDDKLNDKQDTLVSGTNLKTINNISLLGSGNIDIQGGGGGEMNVQADWNEEDTEDDAYIRNKPSLATVATSGSYNDLNDRPTIPTVPTNVSAFTNDAGYLTQHQDISGKADKSELTSHTSNTNIHVTTNEKNTWNNKSDFSGSYNDLTDKPTIPDVSNYYTKTEVDAELSDKQDTLVSGTNLKTINNISLLGSGNIDIQGGGGGEMNVQADWNEEDTEDDAYIRNKPSLATVATSGSYNDLNDRPTIPTVPTNVSAFTNDAGYLTQHQDISGKADKSELTSHTSNTNIHVTTNEKNTWNGKQDALVSGTNIKTINNQTLLGNGNITIGGQQNVQSDWNVTDSTSDAYIKNKPTIGNGLSSNDYTTIEKTKLAGIEAGAEVNVQSDWNVTNSTSDAYIKNKPSLATVATSGSYNDLNNKPYIPTVPDAVYHLATVATSGSYNDLVDRPTIPTVVQTTGTSTTSVMSQNAVTTQLGNKADASRLGGLSLVKLTQSEYDALTTKDNNTLYVIVS